jgi:hypothetical protein
MFLFSFCFGLACGAVMFAVANGTTMEQRALKIVNNCLNTNICSYLETSGGQSFYQYLNVAHF